jgi:hypothetical protein
MSELKICNFCNLQSYRRRAVKEGKKIILLPAKGDSLGGTDVFMVPKDLKIVEKIPVEYKISWMWEITDHCIC